MAHATSHLTAFSFDVCSVVLGMEGEALCMFVTGCTTLRPAYYTASLALLLSLKGNEQPQVSSNCDY